MQPGDSGLDLLQDEFLRDALTGRDSCKVTWEYAYHAGEGGEVVHGADGGAMCGELQQTWRVGLMSTN